MSTPPNKISAGEREVTRYTVPDAGDRGVEREQQNRINKALEERVSEAETAIVEISASGGGGGGSTPEDALLRVNNLQDVPSKDVARTNLGATTVGEALFIAANPSALTFVRINADNSVTFRSYADTKTDLGATTVGNSFFTTANPSAVTFPRVNADNTVTYLSAANFRNALGAPGADTQVIFNDGGVLGAEAGFEYDKVGNELSVVTLSASDVFTTIVTADEGTIGNMFADLAQFTFNGNTVWHAGNDGAGSGLDADLLDAQSGAYYLARGNHTGTQAQSTVTNLETDLAARQLDIQWKDEGVNQGASGAVTTVDFVGAGVSAAESSGTLTVTISGGGGGVALSDNNVWTGTNKFQNTLNREVAAGADGYILMTTVGVQNTVLGFNDSGSTNAYGVADETSYVGNLNAYGLAFVTNGSLAGTVNTAGDWVFTGTASADTASAGDNTTKLATTAFVKSERKFGYVGSATVAGSAATTLTISSLDLATDQEYEAEFEMDNATGSVTNLSLYFNSDTTATNYYMRYVFANGTALSTSVSNDSAMISVAANQNCSIRFKIRKDFDGKTRAWFEVTQNAVGSSMNLVIGHVAWTSTSNVTGITISASVASSLAIGSTIRVFRVKS